MNAYVAPSPCTTYQRQRPAMSSGAYYYASSSPLSLLAPTSSSSSSSRPTGVEISSPSPYQRLLTPATAAAVATLPAAATAALKAYSSPPYQRTLVVPPQRERERRQGCAGLLFCLAVLLFLLFLGGLGYFIYWLLETYVFTSSSSSSHTSSSSSSTGTFFASSSSSSPIVRTGQLVPLATYSNSFMPIGSVVSAPGSQFLYLIPNGFHTVIQIFRVDDFTGAITLISNLALQSNSCPATSLFISSNGAYLYVIYATTNSTACNPALVAYPVDLITGFFSTALGTPAYVGSTAVIVVSAMIDNGTIACVAVVNTIGDSFVYTYNALNLTQNSYVSVLVQSTSSSIPLGLALSPPNYLYALKYAAGEDYVSDLLGSSQFIDLDYPSTDPFQQLLSFVGTSLYVAGSVGIVALLVNPATGALTNLGTSLTFYVGQYSCNQAVATSDGFLYNLINGTTIVSYQGYTPLTTPAVSISPATVIPSSTYCQLVLVLNSFLLLTSSDRATIQVWAIT